VIGKGLPKGRRSHLQKSEKREDATRLAAKKRLCYCHLRCEMPKQFHLKNVLHVALSKQKSPVSAPSFFVGEAGKTNPSALFIEKHPCEVHRDAGKLG
jgi:hypothetical protein